MSSERFEDKIAAALTKTDCKNNAKILLYECQYFLKNICKKNTSAEKQAKCILKKVYVEVRMLRT